MASVEVSVIIPVFDEAPNIGPLVRMLQEALEPVCTGYEIIFVAGGSRDGTEELILQEQAADPRVKLLWLSRRFGHQEAITAGFDYAAGDAVITMDGDMQHPPSVLPELLEKWRLGNQVVTTLRVSTEKAGPLKRISSSWFYKVFSVLSGLDLKDGSADFRLLDRVVVDTLRGFPERARFWRGLVQWVGFDQTGVAYTAEARAAGESKYSVRRRLRFGLMATLSFSATPLYLVAGVGFFIAFLSFAYGTYAVVAKLLADIQILGWASLLAALAFLGGIQLISLGVVGAYVARIYEETKGRPPYVVKRPYGFEDTGSQHTSERVRGPD